MARRANRAVRNGPRKGRGGRMTLGPAFARVLAADFARYGAKRIRALRRQQPYDYLKFVAALIPPESGSGPAEPVTMTEEEFSAMIEMLRAGAAKHDEAVARARAAYEARRAQVSPQSQPPQ